MFDDLLNKDIEPSLCDVVINLKKREWEARQAIILRQSDLNLMDESDEHYNECKQQIEYYRGVIKGLRYGIVMCRTLIAIKDGEEDADIR